MDESTHTAKTLFEEAVAWLHEHYGQFEFFTERDLVWTLQTRLRMLISERQLRYEVFNDYPLLPGPRRARSTDLVIRGTSSHEILLAAEFKYEPSHRRAEFLAQPGKLPVVFWGADGVAKDVARIGQFVEAGAAPMAVAVFIDEGRHSRHRSAHPGTAWLDWDSSEQVVRHRRFCGHSGLLVDVPPTSSKLLRIGRIQIEPAHTQQLAPSASSRRSARLPEM
jgi:hypothetical protein